MKLYPIFSIFFFALVFFSTACTSEVANPKMEDELTTVDTSSIDSSKIEEEGPKKGQTAYILVNNLRLRQNHDLKSKVIAMLKEGEEVIYLGEVSDNKEEIELRGEQKVAPFYRVKTDKGNIGWAYGGALSFKVDAPVVETYKVVIAFVKDSKNTNAKAMADWSYYSSEALDAARKGGLLTSFADEDFDKVPIKDREGKVLDEVNIMRFTRDHRWGLVCIEKGKNPHFIPFAPEMAQAVIDHFQLAIAEDLGQE
jgi:hypothetical protein